MTWNDWIDRLDLDVRDMVRDRYRIRRSWAWDDDETIRAIMAVPYHFADVVITAANVAKVTGSIDAGKNAGATITAGQLGYIDSSSLWQLSDANSAAAAKRIDGVALHDSRSGQPITMQTTGTITIGGTVAIGTIYVLSGTAGGIAPHGDLASGMTTCIFGVATTAAIIAINIYNSGAAVP